MEYALSYALNNFKKVDPAGPITFDNVKAHRLFARNEDENGFIMVHVAMDSYTNRLVVHSEELLAAAKAKDR